MPCCLFVLVCVGFNLTLVWDLYVRLCVGNGLLLCVFVCVCVCLFVCLFVWLMLLVQIFEPLLKVVAPSFRPSGVLCF